MIIGNVAIYAVGVLQLSTFVGFEKAVALGLTPFIIGDLVKTAVASALFPALWSKITK